MVAVLQRSILVWLACLASGCALSGILLGFPISGLVIAVAISGGHVLLLAAEFGLLAYRSQAGSAMPVTVRQLLLAWAVEAVMDVRVFAWRQPFRSRACADVGGRPGVRGILFVHGYFCNRGFWNPWLERCARSGVPCIGVNLEPVFSPIERYVPILEAAVKRLEEECGVAPLMVCHSMGGLAARAWMASAPGGDERVHRVITIATPHRGTVLARWVGAANARQMRRNSAWLAELAQREPALRAHRFTCFYGHADNIVMPADAAILPGSKAIHLAGTPHVAMAFHADVFKEVARWIDRPAFAVAAGMD